MDAPESPPLDRALARVGDRWTLLIISALLGGPRRFKDLQEDLGGIAPNVLVQRLRQLEGDGLVVATPYCRRPPRFVYELTRAARELTGALRLLAEWGARQSESGGVLRHAACGMPVEARWYCATCGTSVADPDVVEGHFA